MTSAIVKQRVAAAIRGAFVADAASMGTHWIYDPAEMLKTVLSVDQPEFRNPPSPNFYTADEFPGHYGMGMLSPYGEQLLFVTEHIASVETLSGETMSQEMLAWAKTFGGRPDHALSTFVENMENDKKFPDCGADDNQAHIYMKLVPVVARYAGSQDLVDRVKTAILVHQNNQQAIAFGIASARILEAVILGAPLEEALATVEANVSNDLVRAGVPLDVKEAVLEALARGKKEGKQDGNTLDKVLLELSHELMKGKEDSPFYNLAGRSCALPGSFVGPVMLFSKVASSSKNAFAAALRENILASGDTCSRSVFIGAVLAAAAVNEGDKESVPAEWIDKVDKDTMKKIDTAIDSIVGKL